LAPATVAAKERLFPAVTVPVVGVTVTEVTVGDGGLIVIELVPHTLV
jgi:hypothetical protein